MRGVMGPDPRPGYQVEEPEDVRVGGARRLRRPTARDHVLAFVVVRTVVAVGHAGRVQADHLAAVAHGIDAVPLDDGRRGDAAVGPVEKLGTARPFHQSTSGRRDLPRAWGRAPLRCWCRYTHAPPRRPVWNAIPCRGLPTTSRSSRSSDQTTPATRVRPTPCCGNPSGPTAPGQPQGDAPRRP